MEIPALIFLFGFRKRKSCIHQRASCIFFSVTDIDFVFLKPSQKHSGRLVIGAYPGSHHAYQSLFFIQSSKLPGGIIPFCIRRCETEIISCLYQLIILLRSGAVMTQMPLNVWISSTELPFATRSARWELMYPPAQIIRQEDLSL